MKESILTLFDRAAVDRRRVGLTVIRTFDSSLSVAAVSDLISRHRTPGVTEAGDFIVKHRCATDVKDWMCGVESDPVSGLRGGYAEAINTLAANLFGAPSHRLKAHARSAFSGRTWCVFERLSGIHSLASLIESPRGTLVDAKTFTRVTASLAAALQSGLFHADTNASNLFLDDRGDVKLIDYEVAVHFSAAIGRGLALQFSKMWDWRLKRAFDYQQFCDIVRSQLLAFSEPAGLERDFGRFVYYSETRTNRARRKERLQEASGGNPDYLAKMESLLAVR